MTSEPTAASKTEAPCDDCIRSVIVIVNPASGQDKPILGTLNRAFTDAGVDWDIRLTKKAGDARRFAQEAVASGVEAVAVYGGDGTVMEVANGLAGSKVPLAIFPGGTANVMSVELGIPSDLAEAVALVCGSYRQRTIDLGRVGDRYFLLRLGIGFEAGMMNNADRATKNRIGTLAYVISALQTLQQPTDAHYLLTLDGQEIEVDGASVAIANSGNIGLPNMKLAQSIDIADGLLDVLVIPSTDLVSLLTVAASAVGVAENLPHWQVRQVTVQSDPEQPIICDGEPLDPTPISAEIVPQALRVIVPQAVDEQAAKELPDPKVKAN